MTDASLTDCPADITVEECIKYLNKGDIQTEINFKSLNALFGLLTLFHATYALTYMAII